LAAEHRKHEIAHELFAQIVDEDVFRFDAELQRFLARAGSSSSPLAQVSREGDHFALVGILQPLQDHRGIQPTRIGKHCLLYVAHVPLSENE
jgi:hypothetical protein